MTKKNKGIQPDKRSEDELQKIRDLESIAALSGGIAHDYNNLLTVIIGNISLIQSYIEPDDMISHLLDEALEASMTAKSLTQKLITFSRGGAPIMETASIAPVIKSATEFTLSGSNIKCEFSIPDDLWLVHIDKTQIGHVIHNLVMNAREAMPSGGIIKVIAENVNIADKTRVLEKANYVKISIIDQGIGISKEILDKIFDPYFSTKDIGTQKGMGLGLSICYSIIKQHNGNIVAESAAETGTTLHFYIPASEETNVAQKPLKAPEKEKLVLGKGRILVMDDEKMVIKITGHILNRLGYEASFSKDGTQAVEMYKKAMESGSPFDVVILDLTVRGGMGGKEAIKKLIEIDPKIKAIVSSGYSNSPVMTSYKDYGFIGVIAKPYNINEFSKKLNEVLRV
ncbi:MAG: ATP-binding protein [Desulfobacterales bacterium]|nr:ATP-binding protein [Desulfobacterales bacterium]MDX2508899.1 ATP-binding protein [Desulfobacterales bacterium]